VQPETAIAIEGTQSVKLGQWSTREVAAALFFFGFLAVQIAIPTIQLARPRAGKFGWQIYAWDFVSTQPTLTVTTENGEIHEVAPPVGIREWWSDVSFDRGVAEHICRSVSGARAVAITRTYPSPRRGRFECR
jgi:hypothetical protein